MVWDLFQRVPAELLVTINGPLIRAVTNRGSIGNIRRQPPLFGQAERDGSLADGGRALRERSKGPTQMLLFWPVSLPKPPSPDEPTILLCQIDRMGAWQSVAWS